MIAHRRLGGDEGAGVGVEAGVGDHEASGVGPHTTSHHRLGEHITLHGVTLVLEKGDDAAMVGDDGDVGWEWFDRCGCGRHNHLRVDSPDGDRVVGCHLGQPHIHRTGYRCGDRLFYQVNFSSISPRTRIFYGTSLHLCYP